MRIHTPSRKENILRVLGDPDSRRILSLTVDRPKSVIQISEELGIPHRSVYRYVDTLRELGLLTREQHIIADGGGKYALYRSMVKSLTLIFEGEANNLELDLVPNEDILEKFIRFWTYMAG